MHGIRLSQEYQQDPYFGYPFQIGEAECVTGRDLPEFKRVKQTKEPATVAVTVQRSPVGLSMSMK